MAFNIMDAIKNRDQITPPELKQNGRMKIQYISVKNIVPALDNRNYYSTERIESLKASIAVHGVKQNLLVKAIGGGKYELIAGECRWRCSTALYEEGRPEFEFVPCSVERPVDDLDQRILLTTINSTAREISDYEKGLQVQEMNEILDEYERRGATIEAPRRELLMKHLNLTSGQVGRYTAIHNNLSEAFTKEYAKKEIGVSVAYELSKLSEEKQTEAYQLYIEKGGLSLKDVEKLQETKSKDLVGLEKQGQEMLEDFAAPKEGNLSDSDSGSNCNRKESNDDFYDKYGRMKANEYSCYQQYKNFDKTIDIKDERLPEGGFRLYLVQDKEDGLWRSSSARGFIEVGAGRWPHRDVNNPVNSELYPAFETMEKALEYAADTMFWHCNDEQKEILNSFGYKEIYVKSTPEKSWEDMTPCEICRSANPSCAENHCCKTCEEPCNGRQECRLNNSPEESEESEAEPALLVVEGYAKPKERTQEEEPAEPGVLKIEAARFTMRILEREIDKCGIEIRYAEEQEKTAKGALAVAKKEYLNGILSIVQHDLFEMTGDDLFKE